LKPLILITILFSTTMAHAQECQAPGQSYLHEKLKESFVTGPAEKELKDVVIDQRNYNLREEIKALDRRKMYADRAKSKILGEEIHQKFDQMIETTGKNEEIADFPTPGATGRLVGTKDSIAIELTNLSKEDLGVIPPEVLKKLSNKVKIEYKYPYDKYDYFITYDGREMPLQKGLNELQEDFEEACVGRLIENQRTKELWYLDRNSRGVPALSNDSGGYQKPKTTGGKASGQ
jgi:hypothetical protein